MSPSADGAGLVPVCRRKRAFRCELWRALACTSGLGVPQSRVSPSSESDFKVACAKGGVTSSWCDSCPCKQLLWDPGQFTSQLGSSACFLSSCSRWMWIFRVFALYLVGSGL